MKEKTVVPISANKNFKTLKRKRPEGNHAVSYCCEPTPPTDPKSMPGEKAFG